MDFDASQGWAIAILNARFRQNLRNDWKSSLDWTLAITRFIDLQTFTSFWYWLVVIVTWSIAGNWLIGVPFDVLFRARKCAEQELADLEALVDVNVRRIVWTDQMFGTALAGLIGFLLCSLGVAGFIYGFELAQGLFVLTAPLSIVVIVNVRLAHQLHHNPLAGRPLVKRLFRVRLWTQVIAMLALFFSAMYGMYFAVSSQHFF